jgi:DNA invertase Pin-like site-specific DNA recombinase
VSTARQGERGVSLPEQKAAIERLAKQFPLQLDQWFEERETAAKRGRPVWNHMLKELRKGRFRGVVIHKIDRSARNLKDWADLGDLIDQGIDVKFANEGLDLNSRGGRLSADIQAVVAADYIRNLREEAKKGLYGRLKQGFYPWRAPIGYLDNGAAKPKTIDPVKGPLVKQAFALYVSGQWTILPLVEEMYRRGLRNLVGQKVTRNGMHNLLRNPFYMGLTYVRVVNETYQGNHEALISKATFERVQDILHGRVGTRNTIHDFLYRKTIQCGNCGYHLIGELQKGVVYYRCHGKACKKVSIREERFRDAVTDEIQKIAFTDGELAYLKDRLTMLKTSWARDRETAIQAIKVRTEQVTERLNRVTDAYLDQSIDKAMFEERKASLLGERRALEDKLSDYETNRRSIPDEIERCVELAKSAPGLYHKASVEQKRRLLRVLMSNCVIREKSLAFVWQMPFREIATRELSDDGRQSKEMGRDVATLLACLLEVFRDHPELEVLAMSDL